MQLGPGHPQGKFGATHRTRHQSDWGIRRTREYAAGKEKAGACAAQLVFIDVHMHRLFGRLPFRLGREPPNRAGSRRCCQFKRHRCRIQCDPASPGHVALASKDENVH